MRTRQTLYACLLSVILVLGMCLASWALPNPKLPIILPSPPVNFYVQEMPLEVMGEDGTVKTVRFVLPRPAGMLTLQVHGLENAQEGSVRVNGGPWVPLTNATVQVAEPGKSYGGIGGGFATLSLSLPVTVRPGLVHVSFRFNHSDGVNFGFRVLKVNLLDRRGRGVLPASEFSQHDPAGETVPLNDPADTVAGKALWHSARLVTSPGGGFILASCAECHAQDGRDLKYYGYTNNSIYERCLFHGLTHDQATQLVSYIRSLPVPVLGRPWNPPYQPGQGMDSKPISAWAAGAGLDAVLDKDADMLPYLFPNGVTYNPNDKDGIGTQDTLNLRELPVALQLPDWNHWLPRIHPKDAWADTFTNSDFAKFYDGNGPSHAGGNNLRAILANPDPGYHAFIVSDGNAQLPSLLGFWSNALQGSFMQQRQQAYDGTAQYVDKMESTALWRLVKDWELMQEYSLEGNAARIYATPAATPTQGEARSWLSESAFLASPAFVGVPENGVGHSTLEYEYRTNAWYYVQMVLDSGNRHRQGWHPVDWGYAVGRTSDLARASGQGSTLRMAAMLIKGMQQSDTNGTLDTTYGWFPHFAGDMRFFYWTKGTAHQDTFSANAAQSAAVYGQVATAVTGAWFDQMQRYTPAQYQASSQSGQNTVLYAGDSLFNMNQQMLPNLGGVGVDKALLGRIADWNKTVWPDFDWDTLRP